MVYACAKYKYSSIQSLVFNVKPIIGPYQKSWYSTDEVGINYVKKINYLFLPRSKHCLLPLTSFPAFQQSFKVANASLNEHEVLFLKDEQTLSIPVVKFWSYTSMSLSITPCFFLQQSRICLKRTQALLGGSVRLYERAISKMMNLLQQLSFLTIINNINRHGTDGGLS